MDDAWPIPNDSASPSRRGLAEIRAESRSRFHHFSLGVGIFIASLTMLFAASIIGYIVIRTSAVGVSRLAPVHLPASIWLSTAALLGISGALIMAERRVRRERQEAMRRYLVIALSLGLVFLVIQTWSVAEILQQHRASLVYRVSLYGMVTMLIVLHALHVVGGMVVLYITATHGLIGAYDHECHRGLTLCAFYWHFLDVVWIVMLGTFLVTG